MRCPAADARCRDGCARLWRCWALHVKKVPLFRKRRNPDGTWDGKRLGKKVLISQGFTTDFHACWKQPSHNVAVHLHIHLPYAERSVTALDPKGEVPPPFKHHADIHTANGRRKPRSLFTDTVALCLCCICAVTQNGSMWA